MKPLFFLLCLVSCSPIYVGPVEHSPQCAGLETVERFVVSDELSDEVYRETQVAARKLSDAVGVELSVERANGREPNVSDDGRVVRVSCYGGECTEAGNVSWARGSALITIRDGDPDTILHELGHAVAGNPCHSREPGIMAADSRGHHELTEGDIRFLGTSRNAT